MAGIIHSCRFPWLLSPMLGLMLSNPAAAGARPHGIVLEVPPITRPHPRLLVTAERLEEIRHRLAAEEQPWSAAWQRVQAIADRALDAAHDPRPYVGEDPREFFDAATRDGRLVRELALAAAISGERRYRERAVQFLRVWSRARPMPGTAFEPELRYPDAPMLQARGVSAFVYAYDLLGGDAAFAEADARAVREWFRRIGDEVRQGPARWQRNDYFNRQYHNNHLAAHIMGTALIGYALGDREMVQFAIDHPDNPRDFRAQLAGLILMPGDQTHHREPPFAPPPQAGEIYDRYRHFTARFRGLQYAHKSLSLLAFIAEAAHNNGLDLYACTAPGGENLELPFTFYADFYRLRDAGLKGGFYVMDRHGRSPGEQGYDQTSDESWRIGRAGDSPGLWELAHRHYPENEAIRSVLESIDRAAQRAETVGFTGLTHAEPFAADP